MNPSVRDLVDAAVVAESGLAELGEEVEDEWSYVNDLLAAWRARLEDVAAARGSEAASPDTAAAVERAIGEAGRVRDPHRAIDWLSTFPQVVLVALGERP